MNKIKEYIIKNHCFYGFLTLDEKISLNGCYFFLKKGIKEPKFLNLFFEEAEYSLGRVLISFSKSRFSYFCNGFIFKSINDRFSLYDKRNLTAEDVAKELFLIAEDPYKPVMPTSCRYYPEIRQLGVIHL